MCSVRIGLDKTIEELERFIDNIRPESQPLAQAYAAGDGILSYHSGRVKRLLGCALATAGLTAEPAEAYLLALRGALVAPLFSLAADGLEAAIAAQGAVPTIETLCHFLHGLRGVAGAEAHSTHTAVVLNVLGLLDVLPLLAPLIRGCAQVAPGKPAIDVLVACVKLTHIIVSLSPRLQIRYLLGVSVLNGHQKGRPHQKGGVEPAGLCFFGFSLV